MDKPEGRKGSDVLDAILDKVAQAPQHTGPANTLFRARALDQLDVADEVDTRLPLVSRRSWLALVGVGLLVLAFALWAALTPSVTSITASGRVMADPGAVPVAATTSGVVGSVVEPGRSVRAGEPVATIDDTEVTATVEGTVWQTPVVTGATVQAGEPVVTLLPPDSSGQVLLPVPEASAGSIREGMTVRVAGPGGGAAGTVRSVSGPLSGTDVSARTGLVFDDTTTYVLVAVSLQNPLPPGSAVGATIVLSEGTVLTRLLGRS